KVASIRRRVNKATRNRRAPWVRSDVRCQAEWTRSRTLRKQCTKTGRGVPLKKPPCSFMIRTRKGGNRNGASFRSQSPRLRGHTETASAGQFGQHDFHASKTTSIERRATTTRSHN